MAQCCFTSTETVRLIRTGSPGWPPRLSHSSWTLNAPCMKEDVFCCFFHFTGTTLLCKPPSKKTKCKQRKGLPTLKNLSIYGCTIDCHTLFCVKCEMCTGFISFLFQVEVYRNMIVVDCFAQTANLSFVFSSACFSVSSTTLSLCLCFWWLLC